MANKFYKSRPWRKKRKEMLRRDNNECQRCKSLGRYSKAVVVHHIKHLKDRPDLALEDDNLMPLCEACHNSWAHPEKLKKHQVNRREHITVEQW